MSYERSGTLIASDGQLDPLYDILVQAASLCQSLPGCQRYDVDKDEAQNAVRVTERWDSEADHQASLQNPAVLSLIAQGRPMIAAME